MASRPDLSEPAGFPRDRAALYRIVMPAESNPVLRIAGPDGVAALGRRADAGCIVLLDDEASSGAVRPGGWAAALRAVRGSLATEGTAVIELPNLLNPQSCRAWRRSRGGRARPVSWWGACRLMRRAGLRRVSGHAVTHGSAGPVALISMAPGAARQFYRYEQSKGGAGRGPVRLALARFLSATGLLRYFERSFLIVARR